MDRRSVFPDCSARSGSLVAIPRLSCSFRNNSCPSSKAAALIFCRAFTLRSSDEMLASAFSSAVGKMFVALLVRAGVAVYLPLVREIGARREAVGFEEGAVAKQDFGLPELFV